tara:strand:- start:288 stop:455 length:168 start_codon:yes stop_codon:yes gene_type:complete
MKMSKGSSGGKWSGGGKSSGGSKGGGKSSGGNPNWPSRTGSLSGGDRGNNPPGKK